MLIELKNGKRKDVRDALANVLIARKLASPVAVTRELKAQPEISELTGRPKRQYRRRDMTPEG